ncbi:hypothetical protein J3R30DRAFT_3698497 [Lentinula aciculospora]|uniref:Uncharacterized protein n=1 Tax=Lentinula aciculospora TaxID=153920 RepID=A0A9W9A0G3_9AGAR|nr:hypothetical protein J3R30DRAFT_3710207 [Lentinula aciculospora]KAJ4483613.1 hypothetical protein J3R30DRAFT_3698497 [Lentinula aciculospora]
MLSTSIKLTLLAVIVLRLSLGSVNAAPHTLKRNERADSLNVRRSVPVHESVHDARQITGIIDAITDAGEAGSDAAKAAKGGSGAKASKGTKTEAKDQNKGNNTFTPHVVVSPEIDVREISDSESYGK